VIIYKGHAANLGDNEYPINRMEDSTWISDADFEALKSEDVGDGSKDAFHMSGE
jgi:hypothetical protein